MTAPDRPDYHIRTDVAFGPLETVDVGRLADECEEAWFNQSLCVVNDSVIRVGIVRGDFHWHHHENEDEFFYVLEGRLEIDTRTDDGEQTVRLGPRQGFTVPRGVVHRTRARERTVMLMIAGKDVIPTGDEDTLRAPSS